MLELTEFSLRHFVAKRFDPSTKGCCLGLQCGLPPEEGYYIEK